MQTPLNDRDCCWYAVLDHEAPFVPHLQHQHKTDVSLDAIDKKANDRTMNNRYFTFLVTVFVVVTVSVAMTGKPRLSE